MPDVWWLSCTSPSLKLMIRTLWVKRYWSTECFACLPWSACIICLPCGISGIGVASWKAILVEKSTYCEMGGHVKPAILYTLIPLDQADLAKDQSNRIHTNGGELESLVIRVFCNMNAVSKLNIAQYDRTYNCRQWCIQPFSNLTCLTTWERCPCSTYNHDVDRLLP